MKRGFVSLGLWITLWLLIVVALEGVRAFVGNPLDPVTRELQPISGARYATRFVLEASLYSIVGIIVARYVRSAAQAGLFALSLGIAYIVYVQIESGLWYYMTAHPSTLDQFFFTAPILAPLLFTTASCLIWRALGRQPSRHAL